MQTVKRKHEQDSAVAGDSDSDATILDLSDSQGAEPSSPKKTRTMQEVTVCVNVATTVTSTDGEAPGSSSTVVTASTTTTTSTACPVPTIHPFFTKSRLPQPPGNVKWTQTGSVLIATSGPQRASPLIAAFDFDGTLSTVRGTHVHAKNANDWKFVDNTIPDRLKALHAGGYRIVIFSNQRGICDPRNAKRKAGFMGRIENVIDALGNDRPPLLIFGATGGDWCRKPRPGMWELFEKSWNDNVQVDRTKSFYVGDAAGRLAGHRAGMNKDFADTDHKFALNVGCAFYTPEGFFHHDAVPPQVPVTATPHPSHVALLPAFSPRAFLAARRAALLDASHNPIVAQQTPCPELVLIVGSPAAGKSSFAKRFFVNPHGYVHVNQDILKTRDRCLRAAETALKEGKSVVVDNTNPDPEVRAMYLKVAARASGEGDAIPVRCFWIHVDEVVCLHNNFYRAYMSNRAADGTWMERVPGSAAVSNVVAAVVPLPTLAFRSYASRFKQPKVEEGFTEIRKVEFVPAFESPEDEAIWSLYLV